MHMKFFWCAALCATAVSAQSFAPIDDAIHVAIEQGKLPGAVLLIGHNGKVVYERLTASARSCPCPRR